MRIRFLIISFLLVLLCSCNNDEQITDTKPESLLIDPYATFNIGNSTHIFQIQNIEDRYLSNVNLENSFGVNDSILLGYVINFLGKNDNLFFSINKKFSIAELKNSTENIPKSTGHDESFWDWPAYEPTEKEFEDIFTPGPRKILKDYYLFTKDEGISLFFNSSEWASYIPTNQPMVSDGFQTNSHFEITSIKYLSKTDIENMDQGLDNDFSSAFLVEDRQYILIEFTFSLELYNKTDARKIIKIKDGYAKAIVYK